MESSEIFKLKSYEIAKRFLHTAVVVDDEAYIASSSRFYPKSHVVAPTRRGRQSDQADADSVSPKSEHSLNAEAMIDSFAALGVICGVVGPDMSAMVSMKKADIVVLDWRLKEDDPKFAVNLLSNLLSGEEDRNSLRLVAIYTGEQELEEINKDVFQELEDAGLQPRSRNGKNEISYRHGRVVLYAKSSVNLANEFKGRSVSEEDIPRKLVEDFTSMTMGLLPRVALTSLTAVREGEHKVLDRFTSDLDPAYLAHRACLSNPDEAEQHIVNHVAEELRGLMDNLVASQSPAGAESIEDWIRGRNEVDETFMFGQTKLSLNETISLATKGLKKSKLKGNAFEGLSKGFAGQEIDDVDEQLAWIMSFRTVFNAPPPTLWLGSVVTEMICGIEKHLLCMRPRCDCVRLGKDTTFFFLPLGDAKSVREQIVLNIGGKFKRLGVSFDPTGWVQRQFSPSNHKSAVTAKKDDPSDRFVFTDVCGQLYTWQGELKPEYAQRIAQAFTATLSRVAVDESEWLRRMAQTNK